MQELNFRSGRRSLGGAVGSLVLGASLAIGSLGNAPAQTPAIVEVQKITFDAVSVKTAKAGDTRRMLTFSPDGFRSINLPLMMLVRFAYDVKDDQIIGAPEWARTEGFDVEAKVSPEDAVAYLKLTGKQRAEMRQSVLSERFGLKAHMETRELPIYELVVAKGGVKMKNAELVAADPATSKLAEGRGQMRMMPGKLSVLGIKIDTLVGQLAEQHLGRPILDKTGLTGFYDFTLTWTPDSPTMLNGAPVPAAENGEASSIFTALQEQLGLKLEPGKGPVTVLVLDQVQRPVAN